jgi:hypothetical protein
VLRSLKTTTTEAVRAEPVRPRAAGTAKTGAAMTRTRRRFPPRAIEAKADLKQSTRRKRRLAAGTPEPGKPGNRVKGCRHR